MQNALNFIFSIISGLFDLFFNRIEIASGVYLGWVFVVLFIFAIIINSILNIVSNASLGARSNETKYKNIERDMAYRYAAASRVSRSRGK